MVDVTMPRLSDTMQEGTIAKWLKQPGDPVQRGEVLAQIETDKATMDLEAYDAGTLQEILVQEGGTAPIGQAIARLGTGRDGGASAAGAAQNTQTGAPADSAGPPSAAVGDAPATQPAAGTGSSQRESPRAQADAAVAPDPGADAPTPTGAAPLPAATNASQAAAPAPAARGSSQASAAPAFASGSPVQRPGSASADGVPAPMAARPVALPDGVQSAGDGKVRASPLARRMAQERGLDLSTVRGSGPEGRVIRADVEAALAAPPAPPAPAGAAETATAAAEDERVPLSQMRRTIARRMVESTTTVPHFFLTTSVDATELMALRAQINAQLAASGEQLKVSVNDLVVKASALALRKVPEVNVSYAGDHLVRHARVNVGVAVATERGLIVPVVRDADARSLRQVAGEARALAERAQAGTLRPEDYTGGTFTVSNLGMFGVEEFSAVINPPEAAILAVGVVARQPAEHEGQLALRARMRLTLSVDHRALDGATGARYLQALKTLLEQPLLLLV